MRHNHFVASLIFAAVLAILATPALAADPSATSKYIAYIGTYTTGESKGIYAYDYDPTSGKMTSLGLAAATTNPSFVTANTSGHFLYAVNEVDKYEGKASGGVSAFSVDAKTGKLTFLNEVASHGADPCYIALDRTGKFVLVANYTGGSVAVFPILKDGHLGEASSVVQHAGSGPNHERQEGPHAHWIEVTPDNRFAVAADLGLDQLLVYRFDAEKGALSPNDPPFAKVEPGSGPRHFALHPNGKFAYVVDELKSTVNTMTVDLQHGVLKSVQTISTLPRDFTAHNDTAEIEVHPNGKFLYASNRGHDSLAVYSIDPKRGTLKQLEDIPTGGKIPRSFAIDPTGNRLWVANQESGNIVAFHLNPKTGHLTATGEILKVPAAVCIKFVAVN